MGVDGLLEWGKRGVQHVDSVPIHVERAGLADHRDERPVVAALHGFASGTFTWAGVAPGWSAARRVVAWDRPPFGRSARPRPVRGPNDPYSVDAQVRRAVSVLEPEVGGAGLVLVGHSAGALLAVQVTLADVLPVVGLVLMAPALDGAPPAAVRQIASLPGARFVGASALRAALLGAAPALRRLSAHDSPLSEATTVETARCLRRPGTAAALWHLTSTWEPPALLDRLAPLGIPVMVVGGRDDRISRPRSTTDVADRLGADLHLLDDVGHAPQEQVPDVVGPLVGAFVDSIGR